MHKLLFAVIVLAAAPAGVKESRFFSVDLDKKSIVGTQPRVESALQLDLVAATTDQPQYWPNEKVYLKAIAIGFGEAKVKATVQKRDAQAKTYDFGLDKEGLAVIEVLNGEKQKLELGEYRVELEVVGKNKRASTTFAVVEGSLGALSFAHDFKKVTSPAELESAKGAWFLGNASGAGKRWGNGLSFKNQLRADNKPYNGEVDIHSRCMLPGCNGTYAGRSLVKYNVVDGVVAGTLDVGGHSGPFQIEVITPKGSLRHQFEGSSHVERDMVPVSGGMSIVHTAGLAPYEKTVQVPGRQIFVESHAQSKDAFEMPNIIAKDGRVTITARRKMRGVMIVAYSPKADGTFASTKSSRPDVAEGTALPVDVADPFSFITVGGFVDGLFVEAWAIAFRPGALEVAIEAPPSSGPKQTINVKLTANQGRVSGILEAYDNRVASKSALAPLASAIGDGMRNASNAVSSWRDNTGFEESKDKAMEEESMAPPMASPAAPSMGPPSAPKQRAMAPAKRMSMALGGSAAKLKGDARQPLAAAQDDDAPAEVIREGEKKVVFCARVETDSNGLANAQVTLPPQMGRLTLRFVAVKGFDHASAQRDVDSSREAAADIRAPRSFVPGAQLQLPVSVTNATKEKLYVAVSGPGVQPTQREFAPGDHNFDVAWAPTETGKLVVETRNGARRALDRREVSVTKVSEQPVTFSRLEVGSEPKAGPGETVVKYADAGKLLNGIVMNMFTTMESWFGHAEALSAKVAALSVIAAAISRGYIDDDGMKQNVIAGLDKAVRDLESAFIDPSGLVRPYPGLPPSPLWSMWVAKNLNDAAQALAQARSTDARLVMALATARSLREKIDAALQKQGMWADGYDAQGNDVVPVEIDGKVVYRVVTDDAVTRWAADKLVPLVTREKEINEAKLYDTFRFLRAFERVGALQYMTDIARGLYAKGDLASFSALYKTITRGMILAQEPGMLQGPATLGGVYSTPMAMVRFLELQLAMAEKPMPVWRVDVKGVVKFTDGGNAATAVVNPATLKPGGQAMLRVELPQNKDPLEYYALIAVPSTVSVKQTEDILSDYRGQLIYGQQGVGSVQMQVLAVPFRGKRTLDLLVEGAYVGTSPGLVIVRHIENPAAVGTAVVPAVSVR